MMNYSEFPYYRRITAAYIRGLSLNAVQNNGAISSLDADLNGVPFALPEDLSVPDLDDLSEEEQNEIIRIGIDNKLKLYRFKNTHDNLGRIVGVMGFLKSVQMESVLDIGSGRGVFLWPFINAFPYIPITAVDMLDYRVELYKTVQQGGIETLSGIQGDICTLDVPDKSYDIVSMLEVLEHIPDVASVVKSAVRIARKYIVVSVPSKPDDNPDHIHLLTREILQTLFNDAGCKKLKFDEVNNHRILFVTL